MRDELLRLENITKSFSSPTGGESLEILKGINLTLSREEVVAITGKSGSGKSTLLSVAALLTKATSGKIYYMQNEVSSFCDSTLSTLRNKYMGFVFQSSMLLEDFTALENVAMPLLVRGVKKSEAYERAHYYLSLLSVENRAHYRPSILSGGERQRTAIARALSSSPSVVFADEPTGSLDEETAGVIEKVLFKAVKKEKKGLVLVTHNLSFASKADRLYSLQGGVLYEK